VSSYVQPVRGRTAGRGRPALVTGVFLLVSSLALLVPPPASPDSPSFTPSRLVDVLVQGRGATAAVAAVGGRSLAALPIIDGLLARVPAEEAPDQLPAGPTPPTTPPRPAATGPTTAHPR
jgi:hypothetical protein